MLGNTGVVADSQSRTRTNFFSGFALGFLWVRLSHFFWHTCHLWPTTTRISDWTSLGATGMEWNRLAGAFLGRRLLREGLGSFGWSLRFAWIGVSVSDFRSMLGVMSRIHGVFCKLLALCIGMQNPNWVQHVGSVKVGRRVQLQGQAGEAEGCRHMQAHPCSRSRLGGHP